MFLPVGRVVGLLVLTCVSALLALAQQAPGDPAFDPKTLDLTVNPCTDFYQYACNKWLAGNPIPADQSRWTRFNIVTQRNQRVLRDILDQASVAGQKRGAPEQKVGDYYSSCMDERTVMEKGLTPLQPALDHIAALKSKAGLPKLIAYLHRLGVNAVFTFGAQQDFADANRMIASLGPGGLGLPDRDYYLKADPKSMDLRARYQDHVRTMLTLAGEPGARATQDARAVLEIELALARNTMDRAQKRNPGNRYHLTRREDFERGNPEFAWNTYLEAVGAPQFESVNVTEPLYFKELNAALRSMSLDGLKAYLRWQSLHAAAALLPSAFVDANFEFYGKTLSGARQLPERSKRCVNYVNRDLGDALGQLYIARAFNADQKDRAIELMRSLQQAFAADIQQLDWMSEKTKQNALQKLERIDFQVAYPQRWKDYGRLPIVRGDALGNLQRANQFEFARELAKIGKPVDRGEWRVPAPTVDGFYSGQLNQITIPAGILQPPFFSTDPAMSYGSMGSFVGHEFTHGFDDVGRKFDADGNLREWWSPEDNRGFEQRAQCLVEEYSSFVSVNDVHLNGRLTLGENAADNGGVHIALLALQSSATKLPSIEGFTPEQRFFIGFGQTWCDNQTPESLRLRAITDQHSPGR
ncbi:MAG: M13 family metallopeptidase, partial [Bryobacteraceae bacterium]